MRVNKISEIALFMLFLPTIVLAESLASQAIEIEVFTNNNGAIKQLIEQQKLRRSYRLTLHNLNSVENWEKTFSENLPGDEVKAKAEVDRRIEKMGGLPEFNNRVMSAYAPLARAVELGLMEYPAVVINEGFVVYGTDSVVIAMERYKTWLKNNEQR